MMVHTLGIGEYKTFEKPAIITCYGLGSCVGVFIKDNETEISAGAHIFLPNQDTTLAIDQMLRNMKDLGSNLLNLRAKIAGGGHLIPGLPNIGELIAHSVIKELSHHRIFLAGENVGGAVSRTAIYYSESEILKIKIHEHKVMISI